MHVLLFLDHTMGGKGELEDENLLPWLQLLDRMDAVGVWEDEKKVDAALT